MNKGLLVNVYHSPLGDATNHGVTESAKTAVLIGEELPEIFKASTDCPALELELFDPFHDHTLNISAAMGFNLLAKITIWD